MDMVVLLRLIFPGTLKLLPLTERGLVVIEATLNKEGAKFFIEKKADQQGNDGPDRKLKNDKKESDDIVRLYKRLTGSSNVPKELEEAQARVRDAGLASRRLLATSRDNTLLHSVLSLMLLRPISHFVFWTDYSFVRSDRLLL